MDKDVVVVLRCLGLIKPLPGIFHMPQIVRNFQACCVDLCRIGFHNSTGIGYLHYAADFGIHVSELSYIKANFVTAAQFIFVLNGLYQNRVAVDFKDGCNKRVFNFILFIIPQAVYRFEIIREEIHLGFIVGAVAG